MIPLRKEHINNFKTKLSLKSEQTQETYFLIVDKFLRYVKNDLTTNNTIKFFTTISKNSIHTTFYAIRFFYNSAGIPFDLRIGDIATKGTIQRIRESFNPDEVNAFIKASKLYGGIIDIGYAAISTIYGARRKEIYNIEPKDIAEDISTLKIHTLKGGQDRVHLIPEEIKEVIKDFRYGLTRIKKKPVVTTLNMMFDNLCHKGGIELRPRIGFHSIRRSLISELMMTDINPTVIRDFLRWKTRESDIIMNYTIFNYERVDKMVFEKHPFLEYWR